VQFYKALDVEERPMADPSRTGLDALARDALAIGDIQSAAFFLVTPGSPALELGAAAGIEGPALDGLVNAVRNPAHPVARAVNDAGPTFDVPPVNPGGPKLRSHLPLGANGGGRRTVVGVLAVAHDAPLGEADRQRLVELADRAAVIAHA
jgi:hypothetical protein